MDGLRQDPVKRERAAKKQLPAFSSLSEIFPAVRGSFYAKG
jgi:hypothetical protein